MRDDGEMARMPDLQAFAREHALPVVTIADLIDYRLGQEMLVHPVAETTMRPRSGGVSSEFRACVYATDVEETEYLALVLGDIKADEPVLVRVQTAGHAARRVRRRRRGRDDHPATVALRMIEEAGRGILLYVFPRARDQPARRGWRGARAGAAAPRRRGCATSASARRCWRTWARGRSAC